jgi:hypothetical protein
MQILDSYSIFEQEEKQQEGSTIRTLSISEFTAKYSGISSTSIDIQRSKN